MYTDGQGHVTVPIGIGRKARLMILDTGGVTSVLSSTVADELNLSIGPGSGELDLRGHTLSSYATVPSLTIAHAGFKDVRFAIAPAGDGFLNEKADGLLAPDLLAEFDVNLDFRHGEVQLVDSNHCPGTIPYWSPSYASAPFTQDVSGHIALDMTLDGKLVHVALDTGAPVSAMGLPYAKQTFGIGPQSPGVERVGSLGDANDLSQAIYSYTFNSLMIDGLEVKHLRVALLPDNVSQVSNYGPLPDLILGLRELERLHLYIAYKEKIVYFTAADAEYPRDEEIRECYKKQVAKARVEAAARHSSETEIPLNELVAGCSGK